MNTELFTYRKTIINRSFWAAAGTAILLALFNHKDYSLGILLGVAVSAVNFTALSIQVSRLGEGKRGIPFLGTFLIRYGLLGVCIYFAVTLPQINIFGFLIGFFILQINLFLTTFLTRLKKQPEPNNA